ncbi:DUF6191 domain-containing protein [Streptomyces tubbatahanensis]|uniref:DUF6191 domain-containing protein n=1 Tax=Streptomyces tubbatahanensis TaxID=2923272 RepID=UPI00237CEFB4|nr:DUF6191 domain-containing protein [Streptomyces tubbatahanensis]
MFNLLEQLFAPSRKHADDERQRLEHTRVQAGSTDPGAGPIDLSSGHVLIRPPAPRDAAPEDPPPGGSAPRAEAEPPASAPAPRTAPGSATPPPASTGVPARGPDRSADGPDGLADGPDRSADRPGRGGSPQGDQA